MYGFERILVRKGYENSGIAERAERLCPDAEVVVCDRLPPVTGGSLSEKIFNGKKTLAITERTSPFVSPFVKKKGDTDSVCPTFWRVIPCTNCAFKCNYCYLLATYRAVRPYVTINANTGKMFSELDKQISTHPERCVNYSMGELADALDLDPITEYSKILVPFFASKPNAFLYMLTKSNCVENLIGLGHQGHTIVAWSMNARIIVQTIEQGAASLTERIQAAKKCQAAGYPLRLRFDPLLPIPDWQRHYAEFVEQVLSQLKPERITLGSFRLLGNLKGIMQKCYPDSILLDIPVVKATRDTRGRLEYQTRLELYEFVIREIRKYNPMVMIDLCKEEPVVKKALSGKINPGKCACV